MPHNNVERIRNQTAANRITYLQTQDVDGYYAFYFLALDSGKDRAYKKAVRAEGTCNLEDYSEIIHSGFGLKPTQDDIRIVEEKTGIEVAELFPELVQ
ncbi:MAG: hypothetical protein EB060_10045 [Proteobacteria bacterium]|nr:hypothetical protein [Pseudomonadota bacterium]